MIPDCFLDTNVLVYAAAGRGDDARKRVRALELISREQFAISAQVLREFYVTVVRKAAVRMSPLEALEWIEQLEKFPCVALDSRLVKIAIENSERCKTSYWVAAILAAADAAGAKIVFSEDLSHGQRYGSIEVRNPFVDLK